MPPTGAVRNGSFYGVAQKVPKINESLASPLPEWLWEIRASSLGGSWGSGEKPTALSTPVLVKQRVVVAKGEGCGGLL